MTDSVESVLQKSREEFEKWLGSLRPLQHYEQHRLWDAWQASRSALEPMLAELNDLRHQIEYAQGAIGGNPSIYVHDKIYHLKNRAEAAEQALREAQAWKESAMLVLGGIDLQAVGKQLGLPLGSDIGPAILPAIKRLQQAAPLGKVMYLQELLSAYADEMALRVFEDTRERAAKIAADAIAPNRRDIAEAIRAMQPDILPK